MTKKFQTEQEAFWAGEFGSSYVSRNQNATAVASNVALFARALKGCGPIRSCIEFGSNIGLNLSALRTLYPEQRQYAVEINADAVEQLRAALPDCTVFEDSIVTFDTARAGATDLALIKGVLIHINPEHLDAVYTKLAAVAARYLFVCEYYNPTPVSVPYRGHSDRLFKRDFCGEILDRHPMFKLIDYGFVYRRDPAHPQDDVNWFLMERM